MRAPSFVRALRPLRFLGWTGAIGGTVYLADAAINDDWDTCVTEVFRRRLSKEEQARHPRPKVLILGGGWAGLSMLRKLHCDRFDVTLVSPRNYFLFTPLLASTTTGKTDRNSIIEPIRNFCFRSDASEVKFIEAEAIDIDHSNNKVKCRANSEIRGSHQDEFDVDYDYLVLGVGAKPATFGVPGVEENAVFMKQLNDARKIRTRILDALETACVPGRADEDIDRLLNFCVVGGGPSGVEFAGEIADFLKKDASRAYPEVANRARVNIIEGMAHVLPRYEPDSIAYAEKELKNQGVQLLTNHFVKEVKPGKLVLKHRDKSATSTLPFGVLVWVTGIAPLPMVENMIQSLKKMGQTNSRALAVDQRLRVIGTKNVFAMGDCSASNGLPQTAQVASQEGRYLGRLFNKWEPSMQRNSPSRQDPPIPAVLDDDTEAAFLNLPTFEYQHRGSMAYVGDSKAIADFPDLRVLGMKQGADGSKTYSMAGAMTYWIWRSVYMSKLLSTRNRFAVSSDWAGTSLFGRTTSRYE